MRRILAILGIAFAAVLLLATSASAASPHFVRASASGPNTGGQLTVNFKIAGLGDTTAFLLLCVFVIVNVAVLVLRRDRVGHRHFRTPTPLPVLGAITALVLASPLADRPAHVYIRAGVLLAVGIGLWALNKVVMKVRGEA